MRSLYSLVFAPLLLLAALSAAGPASADPLCRTVLPDGRVFFTRPFVNGNQFFCGSPAAAPMANGGATLPLVRFTTGQIGPFTTGQIGPVTTGQIGPFTTGNIGPLATFTNSAPAAAMHR